MSILNARLIEQKFDEEPRRAQEILPELIYKLIKMSIKQKEIHFPQISSTGFDGILDVDEETPYIPHGKSVWEIGTNIEPKEKANEDFNKRCLNPLGIEQKNTTYIFVTHRIWNYKQTSTEWTSEKKELGIWKDVRIIDGNDIEKWLEETPSVSAWLAEKLNIDYNFKTLDGYFENWIKSAELKITEDFILRGRDNKANEVISWAESDKKRLYLSANSKDEALMFFIAVIRKSPEQIKEKIINSTFVVEDYKTLKSLSFYTKNSIIIPLFEIPESCDFDDFRVIIPVSYYNLNRKDENTIIIKVQKRSEYVDGLRSLGVNDHQRINEIIHESRGSLLKLKKILSNEESVKKPRWVEKDGLIDLVPAMLVGMWNNNYDGDKEVISKFSNCSYDEYINKITPFLSIEDPPIFFKEGVYYIFTSTWDYIFNYISAIDFAKFKEIVLSVFDVSEVDNEEIDDKKILYEFFFSKDKYSKAIKYGLIKSLEQINIMKDIINNFSKNIDGEINYLIEQIYSKIDSKNKLNNISEYIKYLSQISPKETMKYFLGEIDKKDDYFYSLFNTEKESLFSGNNYINILFALEILAYYGRKNAIDVCRILAKISEKNYVYKMANKPDNSLFNLLNPHNSKLPLGSEDRIRLIRSIYKENPNTIWKLIMEFLPDSSRYRYYDQTELPKPINLESQKIIINHKEFIELLLTFTMEIISNDYNKWIELFNKISSKYNEHLIEKIVETFESQMGFFDDEAKFHLSNKLREIIVKHKEFKDALWVLSDEVIEELIDFYYKIEPVDPILKYQYLFKGKPDLLNEETYGLNFADDKMTEIVNEERKKAFEEIFEKYGEQGIINFCIKMNNYSEIGKALMYVFHNELNNELLLALIKNNKREIIFNYLSEMYNLKGIEIFNEIVSNDLFCYENKIKLLNLIFLSKELFEFIEKLGPNYEKDYWCSLELGLNSYFLDKSMMLYYIDKTIQYNVAYKSIGIIDYKDFIDSERSLTVLEKSLDYILNFFKNNPNKFEQYDRYLILNIFKELDKDKNIDIERLAKLELQYYFVYGIDDKPTTLINNIIKFPELFIDLINIKSKMFEVKNISEEENSKIRICYDLSEKIDTLPGFYNDEIDENEFKCWFENVLKEFRNNGNTKHGEMAIGRLLSYSPIGNDGNWPHELVRDFLEANYTENIKQGFIDGKRSQRGTFIPSYGKDEKHLADEFFCYSKEFEFDWNKCSRIMNEIGEDYLFYSKRFEKEDEI